MDRGDIIRQREIDILDEDNAGTLHNKLSILGRDLLLDTLPDIISGNINPVKQNEREATYAWNLTSDIELLIGMMRNVKFLIALEVLVLGQEHILD